MTWSRSAVAGAGAADGLDVDTIGCEALDVVPPIIDHEHRTIRTNGEVDGIDRSTERARELGAVVLLEPREGPSGWRSVVSSPQVPHPCAVRYAWADNPEGCNFINQNGLPAAPFRTDDWSLLTEGVR